MFPRVRNLALLLAAFSISAFTQTANRADQDFPIELGTSGGNVNDHSRAFCCSGTLGAAVTRGGALHILSNSHVLGRVGFAVEGEDISQPGAIDTGCRIDPSNIVADYVTSPAPGVSNVDAALALAREGAVNPTGEIIGIGIPSATPATPAVGGAVAKAGRTTGLTCSSIGSVDTDVLVMYQDGCNSGRKRRISYTNQVVINSSSFSAGGDSGSLIVTADTRQPVALLYAGSSSTTIGNPIQDVINALGISFVGGSGGTVSCGAAAAGASTQHSSSLGLSRAEVARARNAKNLNRENLFKNPAVQGVGIGEDPNTPGVAAIYIYVEQGVPHDRLPEQLDGMNTVIVRTDQFRATGWNEKLMPAGSCKK